MEDVVGKWGLYPWFEEHGLDLIHPDDLDEIRSFFPSGMVFECVGIEGDYMVIRYGSRCFRVKPSLFKTVPRPGKVFGEEVRFQKSDEIVSGTITGIGWHFKKEEPVYTVSFQGAPLTKQYWFKDFLDADDKLNTA